MTSAPTPHLDVEDHLRLDDAGGDDDIRYEDVGGAQYAMTGASSRHNLLVGGIYSTVRRPALDDGCRPFDDPRAGRRDPPHLPRGDDRGGRPLPDVGLA